MDYKKRVSSLTVFGYKKQKIIFQPKMQRLYKISLRNANYNQNATLICTSLQPSGLTRS